MAYYLDDNEIQEYLKEYFEEYGTIEKAFNYLIKENYRDLFQMDRWNEPDFYELFIPYNGLNWKVVIKEDGGLDVSYDSRRLYWSWVVKFPTGEVLCAGDNSHLD